TIRSKTQRGAHLSVDALGSQVTCENSIRCLRKRGRHVQVGLLTGDDASPRVPLELALSHELEIVGSHGLQASYYPQLLDMVSSGRLDLSPLIERLISLSEAPEALRGMGNFSHSGMQIIDRIS
ncbi:MAG: zinc-binding dehydrogenase, partial [Lacipirellulaceae bacterium]